LRVRPDCIPCFLRQVVNALRLSSIDDSRIERAQREVMTYLLSLDWDLSPPEIDYVVQRVIREYAGGDPYREVKKRSNDEALSIYGECERIVESSEDPLRTAVKLAIAGNVIDFGPYTSYDLKGTIDRVLKSDLSIDHYPLLKEKFQRASRILYFSDNAGEIVLDKLLVETMLSLREVRFTFVVKGGPMINDATLEDFYYVSFSDIDAVEVRTVSNGDEGTGPDRRSEEVLKWIREHDLVISKGQGNYEILGEFNGIFHMLLVKCPVVAADLNASVGDIVLIYR